MSDRLTEEAKKKKAESTHEARLLSLGRIASVRVRLRVLVGFNMWIVRRLPAAENPEHEQRNERAARRQRMKLAAGGNADGGRQPDGASRRQALHFKPVGELRIVPAPMKPMPAATPWITRVNASACALIDMPAITNSADPSETRLCVRKPAG